MKLSILIMGLIALIMLAVPVMAIDSSSATISATGEIVQTLSISTNVNSIDFGKFIVGDNFVNPSPTGYLTVVSEFVPNWKVTASTSDGYGYMRTSTGSYLTSKLQQNNFLNGNAYVDVQGLNFSGSSSTQMAEVFKQNVLITDAPGSYSTVITYTIAAV